MSFVQSVATTVPDYELTQDELLELGRQVLHGKVPFVEQALDLFRHAGVDCRYLVRRPEELLAGHGLKWRNDVYIDECRVMGERLLEELLHDADVEAQEIDMIITTSCTGFMIPALDSHLINRFEMRSDVRRIPLTELGCAAGAMALSAADDHLRAYPDHKVVVLAVEIPSMTYLSGDMTVANLVSAALFGDGGAAVLVNGEQGPLEIVASRSHFFHDTVEMMGFDLMDDGFRIILDKRVPELLEKRLPAALDAFLAAHGVELADIQRYLFHPGGRKILDTLAELLDLDDHDLRFSRQTLREVGNLSSATILWVLEKALAAGPAPGYGLLCAFGPGFGAEMLLSRQATPC